MAGIKLVEEKRSKSLERFGAIKRTSSISRPYQFAIGGCPSAMSQSDENVFKLRQNAVTHEPLTVGIM